MESIALLNQLGLRDTLNVMLIVLLIGTKTHTCGSISIQLMSSLKFVSGLTTMKEKMTQGTWPLRRVKLASRCADRILRASVHDMCTMQSWHSQANRISTGEFRLE